jgi:hypothetical protein
MEYLMRGGHWPIGATPPVAAACSLREETVFGLEETESCTRFSKKMA